MKYNRLVLSSGFTLLELMITVAIIAILTSIALPSYQNYVLRAHRTEARNALMTVARLMERNYTVSGRYDKDADNNDVDAGNQLAAWGLAQSETERYKLSLSDVTATTFTVTATAQGAQAKDIDCAILTLDHVGRQKGTKKGESENNPSCWQR